MTRNDVEMFPPIFEGQELSLHSKLYATLSGDPEGLTPEELAEECIRWGLAVGERERVVERSIPRSTLSALRVRQVPTGK
jgi:hypothetical protein